MNLSSHNHFVDDAAIHGHSTTMAAYEMHTGFNHLTTSPYRNVNDGFDSGAQ